MFIFSLIQYFIHYKHFQFIHSITITTTFIIIIIINQVNIITINLALITILIMGTSAIIIIIIKDIVELAIVAKIVINKTKAAAFTTITNTSTTIEDNSIIITTNMVFDFLSSVGAIADLYKVITKLIIIIINPFKH